MKYRLIKNFLTRISRIIFYLLPKEIRQQNYENDLEAELRLKLKKETVERLGEHFKKSLILKNNTIRKYAIKTALLNDKNREYYYLEFGAGTGESINFFSKFVNKIFCFDSFEGLQEDWAGSNLARGHFNRDKKIPQLEPNVICIVGMVQDTLDDFLKKNNPKINFVHFDMDTYTPTKFVLEKLKPYLVKDAVILFDELYNYVGWENGEYKALREAFGENEFDFLAFEIDDQRSAIRIK